MKLEIQALSSLNHDLSRLWIREVVQDENQYSFLSRVAEWIEVEWRSNVTSLYRNDVQTLLEFVEAALTSDDLELQTLVAIGFVEALAYYNRPFIEDLWPVLGAETRSQLKAFWPSDLAGFMP